MRCAYQSDDLYKAPEGEEDGEHHLVKCYLRSPYSFRRSENGRIKDHDMFLFCMLEDDLTDYSRIAGKGGGSLGRQS